VLLGIALASIRQLKTARLEDQVAAPSDVAITAARIATIVLIAVGLTAVGVSNLYAERPQAETAPGTADTVYQVVIPVDATFTPVGQYDYVPIEFYDACNFARANRASQAMPGSCDKQHIEPCSIGGSSGPRST